MEPQMYASKQLPIYDSIIIKSIIALPDTPLSISNIYQSLFIHLHLPTLIIDVFLFIF